MAEPNTDHGLGWAKPGSRPKVFETDFHRHRISCYELHR